jgi:hypothetical protein
VQCACADGEVIRIGLAGHDHRSEYPRNHAGRTGTKEGCAVGLRSVPL